VPRTEGVKPSNRKS